MNDISAAGGGTVTSITAGAGLNTTSNNSSTDGGSITSSGTLYLTRSGVTPGTYRGVITVDKYGRVTNATNSWPEADEISYSPEDTSWQVTNVESALNDLFTNKAELASPALTGTPTAPTASAGTNTTQIATTAFVKNAVDNAVPSGSNVAPSMDGTASAGVSNNFSRGDHVHPSDTTKADKNKVGQITINGTANDIVSYERTTINGIRGIKYGYGNYPTDLDSYGFIPDSEGFATAMSTISDTYAPLNMPSFTGGVGIGVTAENNKVISNKEIDVVNSSGTVQSAMYPSGNIYSRKNIISGDTTDTAEVNHTVQSSGGKLQMWVNNTGKGLYGVNKSSKGQNILRVQEDGRVIIYGADASGENKVMIAHNGSNIWIGCSQTSGAHHIGGMYIDAGYDSANSKGYETIKVSVPNSANTNATNYNVYHEGYKPTPQDIGFTNTLVQTGVSIINSRLKTLNGGYCIVGKMVFVSFTMQFNATMGAPDWWEILSGMPKPARGSALSCAGLQLKGTFNAYVGNDQKLIISTSNLSLKSGDWLMVTGFYFIP